MALFTKLRERVTGSVAIKFDNLDNIAKREEDNSEESEADQAFMTRHNKSNVSVFCKEKQMKPESTAMSKQKLLATKFINVVPSSNNENVPPQQTNFSEGHTLSKKASFNTLHTQLQKEETQPTAPQIDLKSDLGSNKDNRFATSRSVSFHKAPVAAALPANLPKPASSKSQESEEAFEDVHAYSDEDIDEHELSKQDRIELVFSKARHNHADEVLLAIQNGFNVNTKDANGNTLLHICAQNNRKKLASTLLQKFPQCNSQGENFKHLTPLDYAEKYGFQGMADWLRDFGEATRTARNVSKIR